MGGWLAEEEIGWLGGGRCRGGEGRVRTTTSTSQECCTAAAQ